MKKSVKEEKSDSNKKNIIHHQQGHGIKTKKNIIHHSHIRHEIKKHNIAHHSPKQESGKILVENFVHLQKVMTNLAEKFDTLSGNITKLLQLFELTAKTFAEKLPIGSTDIQKDKEFLDKLNILTEQNKTIAKGLTLLEEKLRSRVYGTAMEQPSQLRPRPPQRF